jgi:hypothetical protein
VIIKQQKVFDMFEQLGFENLNPTQASMILALILGALFGAIAHHLKFCFRSAVVVHRKRRPKCTRHLVCRLRNGCSGHAVADPDRIYLL